ncbi:MAG: hypothetical protein ACM33T_04395 [Solirubrobacterales bacterium]
MPEYACTAEKCITCRYWDGDRILRERMIIAHSSQDKGKCKNRESPACGLLKHVTATCNHHRAAGPSFA